ncbi:RNA-directed DNA polymerase from mobile element jockey [Stylophora pistillata]|uniref:RNA-directed DNA polymerase from mobile element jockey n=1 Tax=Stylophora pistillata TaxID=50429 RepID=A0A2B4RE69_STYPI|nr:RNA-directed DNA polymerase from mobile element jockey [Stylophora pistillata]
MLCFWTSLRRSIASVNHKILLHKHCNFGIVGSLLAWCGDYLLCRKQRVVVDGKSSSWLNITSGVPQGSILGPLFFVIVISDLPEVVQQSSVALYADDCKACRVVNCANDLMMFQDDLDSLCACSQRNRMIFNVKKCKMMRITRKKQPFRSSFTLNGSDIEEVYEFRDLGLLMNHHLSWNSHVDAITNKANRILGLLGRTCRDLKDTETLKMLYCTSGCVNVYFKLEFKRIVRASIIISTLKYAAMDGKFGSFVVDPSSITVLQDETPASSSKKSTGEKGSLLVVFFFLLVVFVLIYFVCRSKKQILRHELREIENIDAKDLDVAIRQKDGDERDPVRAYVLYASKRPDDLKTPDSPFYLAVNHTIKALKTPDSPFYLAVNHTTKALKTPDSPFYLAINYTTKALKTPDSPFYLAINHTTKALKTPDSPFYLAINHTTKALKTPDSPFYLAINHTTKAVNTKPWFKSAPMGVNKLKSLMKTMAEKAGLYA